jgi:hypothetical protein
LIILITGLNVGMREEEKWKNDLGGLVESNIDEEGRIYWRGGDKSSALDIHIFKLFVTLRNSNK